MQALGWGPSRAFCVEGGFTSWTGDRDGCRKVGIGDSTCFASKVETAKAVVRRPMGDRNPFRRGTADAAQEGCGSRGGRDQNSGQGLRPRRPRGRPCRRGCPWRCAEARNAIGAARAANELVRDGG
jgi:hypothetical protein